MSIDTVFSFIRRYRSWFFWGGLAIVGVFIIVYVDVSLRARSSFQQAEKYMSWYQDPALKKAALNEEFEHKKADIDKKLKKGTLSESQYQQNLELLEFDRDHQLQESDLKYAYQWYKDTYQLFSPPESSWVKQARIKAPQTLELWKQQLREKNIPFNETMLE